MLGLELSHVQRVWLPIALCAPHCQCDCASVPFLHLIIDADRWNSFDQGMQLAAHLWKSYKRED